MRQLLIALTVITITLISGGCKKDQQPADTLLTGTWIKGNNAGDTLYFTKSQDRNVLIFNASFNYSLPAVTQTEYSLVDGKLSLKSFMAAQGDFYVIQSFTWIQEGREFEVLGYEIFPFMSSTVSRFTYTKIN